MQDFSLAGDLSQVQQVLEEGEGYPSEARRMLLEGLPHCIAGAGGRHSYMDQFAELLGEALTELTGLASEKQAVCDRATADAEVQAAEAKAAHEAAAAAAEAAQGAAEAKNAEATALQKAVTAAQKEHKQVEKQGVVEGRERTKVRDHHAKLVSVSEGSLRMLLEDGWEDEEVMAAAVHAIQESLEGINAESVLLAAAPSALGKRAGDRKPFDEITVGFVSEALAQAVAKLGEEIALIEPAEKEAQAELLGLWAIADVARDNLTKAQELAAEANAAFEAAAEVESEAKAQATVQQKVVRAAGIKQEASRQQVAAVEAARAAMARLCAGDYPEQAPVASPARSTASQKVAEMAVDSPAVSVEANAGA